MDKAIFKGFKALGEPTRLRIMKLLSARSMCVCELSEVLGMLQPRVSQHLRILKEVELVEETREGYWTFYSLNKEKLSDLWSKFIDFVEADLLDLQGFEKEYERLANLDKNERVKEVKERLKG
ncbi:MAG: metalloregulator ArsR/SmtB family transcription factor [Bacillota bacterium]